MPRQPVLDPRFYRLDDTLRRPLTPRTEIGSGGGVLSASADPAHGFGDATAWGFGGATFHDWVIRAPMTLSVWADGDPVFAEDGVYRPSHVTVNARDEATGLQVSEDKFVAPDDVLVSIVSFRNPGEWSIEVEVRVQWGVERGQKWEINGADYYVSRFAPPVADRRFTLPANGRTRLAFALAIAPDDRYVSTEGETARRRAEGYTRDLSAVVAHTEAFDRWATKNTPRFDCPDPWAMRAWANDCAALRRFAGRQMLPVSDVPLTVTRFLETARNRFVGGDFDAPSDSPKVFLSDVFVRQVMGLTVSGDSLTVNPAPDLSAWQSFAVENYEFAGRRFTFVWDTPDTPGDAYDDGDKGFTIYDGKTVLHRQADLSLVTVTIVPQQTFYDGDDE